MVFVMALRVTTSGWSSQAATRTGLTRTRAQRMGFCTAAVLGVISQKINTTSEIRTVEMSSPKVSEKRKARTVAMLEATITATLLITRMVERNTFGLVSKFSISAAFTSPSSTKFLSLMRLMEVRAVSAAEAVAQRMRETTRIVSCNHAVASNGGM